MNAQEILDRLDAGDLTVRYADIVNRRQLDELATVFAADAEWLVPGFSPIHGIEAITETLAQLTRNYPFLIQTVHGGLVRVEGDRAFGRSYNSEWARDTSGANIHMSGVYLDEMVRTTEGWRFSTRRFEFLYRGRGPAVGKFYAPPDLPLWP